uniref:hypothetical protein n=1 Tax=Vibrio vulnificus TaxID=672 RepID=UPI0019D4488E
NTKPIQNITFCQTTKPKHKNIQCFQQNKQQKNKQNQKTDLKQQELKHTPLGSDFMESNELEVAILGERERGAEKTEI